MNNVLPLRKPGENPRLRALTAQQLGHCEGCHRGCVLAIVKGQGVSEPYGYCHKCYHG